MPTQSIITLLALAVLANLAITAAVALPPLFGRRSPFEQPSDASVPLDPSELPLDAPALAATGGRSLGLDAGTYDRIVRTVGFVVLVASAIAVGASGAWQENATAIYVTLGLAAVLVLAMQGSLPARILGPARFVVEASLAIVLITLFVALTGGWRSPFFFTYELVVAGVALTVGLATAAALATAASASYLLAVAVGPSSLPLSSAEAVAVVLNVLAIWLLAFVGVTVGREQRRVRDAAIHLSLRDPLTQLYNRTYFFAAIEREIERAGRTGRRFSALMMDLDELKQINDTFGHHVGDLALRQVADAIRGCLRRIDVAARYGGDEFVVLLPETDPTGGFVVAEKIRFAVAALPARQTTVGGALRSIALTLSIGAVSYPDDGRTADALLASADLAMYSSKRSGKDRVTVGVHQASTEPPGRADASREGHSGPPV